MTTKKALSSVIITKSCQKQVKPTPFKYMALEISMKYLAGIKRETPCRKIGIFSIGKLKPDKRRAGNSVVTDAICMADWLEVAVVEIKRPNAMVPTKKIKVQKSNSR